MHVLGDIVRRRFLHEQFHDFRFRRTEVEKLGWCGAGSQRPDEASCIRSIDSVQQRAKLGVIEDEAWHLMPLDDKQQMLQALCCCLVIMTRECVENKHDLDAHRLPVTAPCLQ